MGEDSDSDVCSGELMGGSYDADAYIVCAVCFGST